MLRGGTLAPHAPLLRQPLARHMALIARPGESEAGVAPTTWHQTCSWQASTTVKIGGRARGNVNLPRHCHFSISSHQSSCPLGCCRLAIATLVTLPPYVVHSSLQR